MNVVRLSTHHQLTPILTRFLPHWHPLDNFTEAVKKVCPVDERYLLFFFFGFKSLSHLLFLIYLRAAVTEKFVEFLAYKATYENVQPNEEIPDFIERIAPEIALELCV
jgi:hypothetical protein